MDVRGVERATEPEWIWRLYFDFRTFFSFIHPFGTKVTPFLILFGVSGI